MHIQCHDALVTVLHHALLQDHPGVLWEQGIASSDHSHPGDIYHPDFSLGHPAYFGLYHSAFAFLRSAASKAGVAAAAS